MIQIYKVDQNNISKIDRNNRLDTDKQSEVNAKFNEYALSHFLKEVYKPSSENREENMFHDMLINKYAEQINKSSNRIEFIKRNPYEAIPHEAHKNFGTGE